MCLNIPISVVYVVILEVWKTHRLIPFDRGKTHRFQVLVNEFAGGSWDGTHLLTMDPNFRDPNTLRNFQCDLGSPSSQYAKGMTGRVQRHEAANSRNLPDSSRFYQFAEVHIYFIHSLFYFDRCSCEWRVLACTFHMFLFIIFNRSRRKKIHVVGSVAPF